MRVATCLPSATEIVCAVGGRVALLAVSDACDWPAGPGGITQLPRFPSAPTDAADGTLVPDLDLIITDDPAALGTRLGGTRVLVLAPRTLADVFADIVRVGDALDLGLTARAVVTGLRARLQAVSERAAALPDRPRVSLRTAPDAPPMRVGPAGPTPWLGELVAHAGGTLASPTEVADVELTLGAAARAYVTRAGPRLIDAVEVLAASLDPAAFPDLTRRHAGRDVAVTRRADPPVPGAASDTS